MMLTSRYITVQGIHETSFCNVTECFHHFVTVSNVWGKVTIVTNVLSQLCDLELVLISVYMALSQQWAAHTLVMWAANHTSPTLHTAIILPALGQYQIILLGYCTYP